MKQEEIKKVVRERYASVAREGGSCCAPKNSCCASANVAETLSKRVGYSDEDINSVPEGANLGLGCGKSCSYCFVKGRGNSA